MTFNKKWVVHNIRNVHISPCTLTTTANINRYWLDSTFVRAICCVLCGSRRFSSSFGTKEKKSMCVWHKIQLDRPYWVTCVCVCVFVFESNIYWLLIKINEFFLYIDYNKKETPGKINSPFRDNNKFIIVMFKGKKKTRYLCVYTFQGNFCLILDVPWKIISTDLILAWWITRLQFFNADY